MNLFRHFGAPWVTILPLQRVYIIDYGWQSCVGKKKNVKMGNQKGGQLRYHLWVRNTACVLTSSACLRWIRGHCPFKISLSVSLNNQCHFAVHPRTSLPLWRCFPFSLPHFSLLFHVCPITFSSPSEYTVCYALFCFLYFKSKRLYSLRYTCIYAPDCRQTRQK